VHEQSTTDPRSEKPGTDFDAVIGAWQVAQQSAARRWHWRTVAREADAYMSIANLYGREPMFMTRARASYLAAFLCAQDHGAVSGMVRAARGFARLGDDEMARRCLAAANGLSRSARDSKKRMPVSGVSDAVGPC